MIGSELSPSRDAAAMVHQGWPPSEVVKRFRSEDANNRNAMSRADYYRIALETTICIEALTIRSVYDVEKIIAARARADENRMEAERQSMAEVLITGPETERVWADELLNYAPASPGDIDAG